MPGAPGGAELLLLWRGGRGVRGGQASRWRRGCAEVAVAGEELGGGGGRCRAKALTPWGWSGGTSTR